jgi:hypothetical protein
MPDDPSLERRGAFTLACIAAGLTASLLFHLWCWLLFLRVPYCGFAMRPCTHCRVPSNPLRPLARGVGRLRGADHVGGRFSPWGPFASLSPVGDQTSSPSSECDRNQIPARHYFREMEPGQRSVTFGEGSGSKSSGGTEKPGDVAATGLPGPPKKTDFRPQVCICERPPGSKPTACPDELPDTPVLPIAKSTRDTVSLFPDRHSATLTESISHQATA